jgi:hypothetical protein
MFIQRPRWHGWRRWFGRGSKIAQTDFVQRLQSQRVIRLASFAATSGRISNGWLQLRHLTLNLSFFIQQC